MSNNWLKALSVFALLSLGACGGGGSLGNSGNSSAGGSAGSGSSAGGSSGNSSGGSSAGIFGGGQAAEEAGIEAMTAEEIFLSAERELADGDEEEAARLFGEVERLYPFSDFARRALLMSAFANQLDGNYEASRSDAGRFLDLYPADQDADYAQYIIALSYYDQIDESSRDSQLILNALQELRVVVERYPGSEYETSALLKFDLAIDQLAGKEMEVGRYYLRRGHFGAAINRFRVVVEDFETTTHTPEALYRLVEAYLSLGLEADAQTAGAILGHNFQATDWFNDAHVLLTGRGLTTEEADPRANRWLRRIWRDGLGLGR
ncbi:MAG: outer membrane protein assembly factor BamD [Pseudomonadota bacterium]